MRLPHVKSSYCAVRRQQFEQEESLEPKAVGETKLRAGAICSLAMFNTAISTSRLKKSLLAFTRELLASP